MEGSWPPNGREEVYMELEGFVGIFQLFVGLSDNLFRGLIQGEGIDYPTLFAVEPSFCT